jgi:hypothetical protein
MILHYGSAGFRPQGCKFMSHKYAFGRNRSRVRVAGTAIKITASGSAGFFQGHINTRCLSVRGALQDGVDGDRSGLFPGPCPGSQSYRGV